MSKYAAEEGSSCEYCGAEAVHRIEGVNVCGDSSCKMQAWTREDEK